MFEELFEHLLNYEAQLRHLVTLALPSSIPATSMVTLLGSSVRPEKFQFLEKWQNRNFDYEIVISVKNPKFIL